MKLKTKPKPVKIIESETPPKQLTATELLQQSYNEMKRLRQHEKQEKINKFKASMFLIIVNINFLSKLILII